MKGQVRTTGGGAYGVRLDDGQLVEASLRGRLKQSTLPEDQVVIGDEVRVDSIDDHWVVEEVLPRRTVILRSRFGGRTVKPLAANVDRMLAVAAARQPKPNREVIDRLLVVAENAGVEPVLIVNKADLDTKGVAGELREKYGSIGYETLAVSAADGTGMDRFRQLVCEGISALAGPSGVGKSTLLNAVEPGLELATGALSRKTDRGRHTTVSSRLIPLECGGLVADTPGFSDVGLWGIPPEELDSCFPEFRELLDQCKFRVCSHLHEPECAVRQAVDEGGISQDRYESYRKLFAETEQLSARERGHT